jgi:putative sterol carrier protein
MSIPFPSDAWVKALMVEINKSEAYAEAAKNWEGDFVFVVDQTDGQSQPTWLYLDLWHGKCREAAQLADETAKTPQFRLSAPLKTWKKVLLKQLDPLQGMMTGQLKLKGNMAMVMKNVKAAKELVACSTLVPTTFPE